MAAAAQPRSLFGGIAAKVKHVFGHGGPQHGVIGQGDAGGNGNQGVDAVALPVPEGADLPDSLWEKCCNCFGEVKEGFTGGCGKIKEGCIGGCAKIKEGCIGGCAKINEGFAAGCAKVKKGYAGCKKWQHYEDICNFICSIICLCATVLVLGALYHVWQHDIQTKNGAHPNHDNVTLPFRGDTLFSTGCYFISSTISTTGFGDVVPQTQEGRIAMFFIILASLLMMTIVAQVLNECLSLLEESFLDLIYAKYDGNPVVKWMIGKSATDRGRRICLRGLLSLLYTFFSWAYGVTLFVWIEHLALFDAMYATLVAQSTVGYGDKSFLTVTGRTNAVVWLVVASLCFNRSLEVLVERRVHRRNRKVLSREDKGFVFAPPHGDENIWLTKRRKNEFFLWKLRQAQMYDETHIEIMTKQFNNAISAAILQGLLT